MLKSISHWAFNPERPLSEVFSMAADLGFEAVEVTIADTGAITPNITAEECATIVEQAKVAGIQLSSLASGYGWMYPVTSADAAIRQQGVEITKASLRVARDLGLDAILMVPGIVDSEFIDGHLGTPYDLAYNNALASFNELKAT